MPKISQLPSAPIQPLVGNEPFVVVQNGVTVKAPVDQIPINLSFPTIAALQAASPPAAEDSVYVEGYYASGDGGGHWRTRGTGAGEITDAAAETWIVADGIQNVKFYGAVGNLLVDDITSINTCIISANQRSICDVFIPSGGYLVTSPVNILSNINLIGAGRFGVEIKLADGGDTHVVTMQSVSNVSVNGVTINGNRDNQTVFGHGIRGSDVSFINIGSDVEIKNAGAYGIGFQSGTISNIYIGSCIIHDCGQDGIDFKNTNSNNDNIQIWGPTIYNYGLNTLASTQTGIDIRGPARIFGPRIIITNAAGVGVRFREGTISDPGGVGGYYSSLIGGNISGQSDSTGVVINSGLVKATGIYCNGCGIGIHVLGASAIVNSNSLDECVIGIFLLTGTPPLSGDKATVNGNTIYTSLATGQGIDIRSNNNIVSCNNITGYQYGIRVSAGATNNSFVGNSIDGSATLSILDGGTNSSFRNNVGFVNESNVISGTFLIDAVGQITVSVPHGLTNITPELEDCSVTVIRDSAVTDVRYGYVVVSATTATDVVVRVYVATASATPAAVAKLSVSIRSKI